MRLSAGMTCEKHKDATAGPEIVDLVDRGVIPWPPPEGKCAFCHCQDYLRAASEGVTARAGKVKHP